MTETQLVDVNALLSDDAAMLALSKTAWAHAGTAMPCSAEGGREGLRAALEVHAAPLQQRYRLEEIEPWLVEVARELTKVVENANHFGTAEWVGNNVVARVERTQHGIRASFWRLTR